MLSELALYEIHSCMADYSGCEPVTIESGHTVIPSTVNGHCFIIVWDICEHLECVRDYMNCIYGTRKTLVQLCVKKVYSARIR
jgi:hypothetical protein